MRSHLNHKNCFFLFIHTLVGYCTSFLVFVIYRGARGQQCAVECAFLAQHPHQKDDGDFYTQHTDTQRPNRKEKKTKNSVLNSFVQQFSSGGIAIKIFFVERHISPEKQKRKKTRFFKYL